MRVIKKDWIYDTKSIMFIVMAAILSFMIAILLFLGHNAMIDYVISNIFDRLYTVSVAMICMYPLFVFKGVCPKLGSDKVYLSTANLPFSKKQLFFKGIKPWLISGPIYILVGAFIETVIKESTVSFAMTYMFSLFKPMILILVMAIFQFQFIALIIICLVKRVKWYKILMSALIFNGALVSLSGISLLLLNIDFNTNYYWPFGIIVFFLLASLSLFLYAWRDVEKIYR